MLTQTKNFCKLARLFFLGCLIPADLHWELELSLAIDRAVVAVEGGP